MGTIPSATARVRYVLVAIICLAVGAAFGPSLVAVAQSTFTDVVVRNTAAEPVPVNDRPILRSGAPRVDGNIPVETQIPPGVIVTDVTVTDNRSCGIQFYRRAGRLVVIKHFPPNSSGHSSELHLETGVASTKDAPLFVGNPGFTGFGIPGERCFARFVFWSGYEG